MAIASGFSLSDIGTGVGCGMKDVADGGTTCSAGSVGASCARVATGVMGETGGLGGELGLEQSRKSKLYAVGRVVGVGALGEDEVASLVGDGRVSAGMVESGGDQGQ